MVLDLIELLWAIAATIGIVLSARNLRGAIIDFRYVIRSGIQNGRRLIAVMHLRSAFSRVLLFILFATLAWGNVASAWQQKDQALIEWMWAVSAIILMVCEFLESRDYVKLIKE